MLMDKKMFYENRRNIKKKEKRNKTLRANIPLKWKIEFNFVLKLIVSNIKDKTTDGWSSFS